MNRIFDDHFYFGYCLLYLIL